MRFTALLLFFCSLIFINASAEEADKFIVFAPPKCGTHLVAKALELISDKKAEYQLCEMLPRAEMVRHVRIVSKNNGFVIAHNWNREILNDLVRRDFKVIFILRDPRDQLVSIQKWLREGQWPWLAVSKIASPEIQIEELITGARFGYSAYSELAWRYALFNATKKSRGFITRFEHLVGEKGNGSRELQLLELINLAAFLGVDLSVERAEEVADQLFGGTRTFRGGLAGSWKEVFTPYQAELYRALYANFLINLGYEP